MLYEDRKKEIETIKERTLVLKLSDADCDRILQKAASHGMTVSELLESFIGDLVDGTFTNGSDERYLAEDWFNRCGFERDDKRTLLWHLLEQNADLENFIELYEENEEYKSPQRSLRSSVKNTKWSQVTRSILKMNCSIGWTIGSRAS